MLCFIVSYKCNFQLYTIILDLYQDYKSLIISFNVPLKCNEFHCIVKIMSCVFKCNIDNIVGTQYNI